MNRTKSSKIIKESKINDLMASVSIDHHLLRL